MNDLERELRKMSRAELVAYHNILVATTRMVDANPRRTAEHLRVVKKILGVGDELKRLKIKRKINRDDLPPYRGNRSQDPFSE